MYSRTIDFLKYYTQCCVRLNTDLDENNQLCHAIRIICSLNQARSQKFAMGGAVLGVWGRSPQPPEANGGLGAKPPAAGGWGFGGKAPSRRRHGGVGAEPPALKNFAFFLQK